MGVTKEPSVWKKLGEQGALVCDEEDRYMHVPAPAVDAVDTTAAGDAFTVSYFPSVTFPAGMPRGLRTNRDSSGVAAMASIDLARSKAS